jgi:vacuolar-type H+-ATPase subunit B/Vma2
MREFHDLQQDLSRIRVFTGRKENTSTISSSGRTVGEDMELGGCCDFCGRRFMTEGRRGGRYKYLWRFSFFLICFV